MFNHPLPQVVLTDLSPPQIYFYSKIPRATGKACSRERNTAEHRRENE
jgi:hypothetical protein